MLTEQYVAQQLASAGFSLYYWANDSTPAEIDFAIQKDGNAYPIEVKASRNVRGKSIAQYIKDNPGLQGLRFSLLDFKEQDWMTNIPLYEIPYRFWDERIRIPPPSAPSAPLREFFPKDTDFRIVEQKELDQAQYLINERLYKSDKKGEKIGFFAFFL